MSTSLDDACSNDQPRSPNYAFATRADVAQLVSQAKRRLAALGGQPRQTVYDDLEAARAKRREHEIEATRLWLGGGYSGNGVSGTRGNGFKGVVGAQATIGSVLAFRVVLRLEGSYGRGMNDFEQKWINGGLVFWIDPDWHP